MVREKVAPPRNDYTRLAGTTRDRSTGVPRLYLGPNHLLILTRKSTREVARRFYYEDITALRCQPTRWGYVIDGVFWVVVTLLWLYTLTSPGNGSGGQVIAVTATVMAAIAQITNWLRGPTCKTWLHTENHTEHLSGLGRYNTARRALRKLHERIIEVQAERYGEAMAVERAFVPYVSLAKPANELPRQPHDARLMKVAFYVSMFFALQGALEFVYGNDGTSVLALWTALASTALCAAATIRSFGTDCPPLARKICAFLVTSMVLTLPITLAAFAFLALIGVDPTSVEHLRDIRPSDGMLFVVRVGLDLASMLFNGACATIGLIVLSRTPVTSAVNAPPD